MQKDVNKTLVGGFVVGALILVIAGIALFGSGDFFKKKMEYVLYFDGSVKGLKVGSPVVFRGVEVGTVKEIALIADGLDFSVQIPVYIEVELEKFQIKRGDPAGEMATDIAVLIERGLRAQLQSQSILTGLLMIELDYYPNREAILRGDAGGPPEIPTIPSTLESLVQTIKDLNLAETTRHLSQAVAGIENLVNSPEIRGSVEALQQTLDAANNLVGNLDKRLVLVLDAMAETVAAAGVLVSDIDREIIPLAEGIQATAQAAARTIEQADQTLVGVDGLLGEDSAVIYQLHTTLKDLSAAAGSIRAWADYMERHPEALLRGKK